MGISGDVSAIKKDRTSEGTHPQCARALTRGRQVSGDVAAQLAAGEQTFASLLDVLAPTYYRCEISPSWRMSFVSKGVEELTGHPVDAFPEVDWQLEVALVRQSHRPWQMPS